MPVTVHMENLTSGMKAKLDTRYKNRKNSIIKVSTPHRTHRSNFRQNSLGDVVGKNRHVLLKLSR